jgi:hypothetical protein
VAISPDGNFVAVVGAFSAITGQGISVFRESAQGTLSLVPGSPFGDVLAGAVRFDPTGRFVLVPGSVYKLDFSTGALTKVSGFTPGGSPWGMTAFQTCVAAASSVNICSPENNSTTTSPVHLLAAVNVGNTFTGAWVYVDGAQVFHSDSPYIATNLTMDPGAHSIEVKGWNSSGAVVRASVHVTVSSGGGCTAPTSAGVNICTPANQSSVTSPVHLLAAVKVNGTLTGAWVQVDGVNQFHSDSPSIDTNLTIDAGAHTIEVKAWNSSGAIVRASADVDVSNGGCLSFSVCCPPPSSAGVKICTPTNGSSASNPVHLVAAITVSGTFTGAWVQVDGINKFHSDSAAIDTDLVIPPGTHTIQVKGWNSSGAIVRASTMVPVGP